MPRLFADADSFDIDQVEPYGAHRVGQIEHNHPRWAATFVVGAVDDSIVADVHVVLGDDDRSPEIEALEVRVAQVPARPRVAYA